MCLVHLVQLQDCFSSACQEQYWGHGGAFVINVLRKQCAFVEIVVVVRGGSSGGGDSGSGGGE